MTGNFIPGRDDVAAARQERAAFFFGAALVYLIGIMGRASLFHNILDGIECALIVDTVALILVLANRRLSKRVQPHLRGFAIVTYILASASVSAVLIILFTRLLALVLPRLASPWAHIQGAQFMYFSYLFLSWSVAGRWLDERARIGDERLRAMEMQSTLLRLETQRLRMQLSPHFTFNTLNMLAVDIPDKPHRALRVLREFNHYLRYTLENAERAFLPATQEIDGLKSYMRIQQMRFGAALKTRISVAGSLREHRLPTFLLQPLAENATKHGVPAANGILEVLVRIVAEPDVLRISMTNAGGLQAPSTVPGTQTGLANIRGRLALHYPGRHSLVLSQREALVAVELELRGEPC